MGTTLASVAVRPLDLKDIGEDEFNTGESSGDTGDRRIQ